MRPGTASKQNEQSLFRCASRLLGYGLHELLHDWLVVIWRRQAIVHVLSGSFLDNTIGHLARHGSRVDVSLPAKPEFEIVEVGRRRILLATIHHDWRSSALLIGPVGHTDRTAQEQLAHVLRELLGVVCADVAAEAMAK